VEGGGSVIEREILDGQERARCQVWLDVPGRGRVLEGEAMLVLPASDNTAFDNGASDNTASDDR